MKFLLKIVEGPNKGAEVALPEGVAVTLGKRDDCDIVLADATLPDAALTLKAAPDGVTLDGEPLDPFHVVARGATAFAAGPADAPWGELVWARSEGSERSESSESSESSDHSDHSENSDPRTPKHRRGCLGCFVALVLLILALAALGWFFRAKVRPCAERFWTGGSQFIATKSGGSRLPRPPEETPDAMNCVPPLSPLAALAARYSLVASGNRLVGDFATRAERLAATAEAYAAKPGIELDFCDDESLRTAAEDTFALVGERNLRVAAVTNRVLVLSGAAANLRRVLDALRADLPKLKNVNVAGVTIPRGGAGLLAGEQEKQEMMASVVSSSVSPVLLQKNKSTARQSPSLPVCGILMTPYPCLVLKNGARVMEGAPFGDGVVLKIGADSVTLTNATGRFTWRP